MRRHKLTVEFSMCEPQKIALGHFLASRIDLLAAGDKDSELELIDKVRLSLPDDEDSVESLRKTLSPDSDTAYLIRNLPENEVFDFAMTSLDPRKIQKQTFAYHIGKALFEIAGAEFKTVASAVRKNPKKLNEKQRAAPHTGNFMHRDYAGVGLEVGKQTSYVALAVPLDQEGAKTDIFILEDVLEKMPRHILERTKANIEFRGLTSFDEDAPPVIMTLAEVLDGLRNPSPTISIVDTRNVSNDWLVIQNDPADIKAVRDAVHEYGDSFLIGPRSLLLLCEDRIFHQGNPGDPNKVHAITPEHMNSRILFHIGGQPRGR